MVSRLVDFVLLFYYICDIREKLNKLNEIGKKLGLKIESNILQLSGLEGFLLKLKILCFLGQGF